MAREIRSSKAFGVAGLLDEKSTVFYTSDLKNKCIGRVSDLVVSRLREFGADELHVRSLLLFSAFEATKVLSYSTHREVPLPSSLEVGLDDSAIAISVAFHWIEGHPPRFEGMVQRVLSGAFSTQFEENLGYLKNFSSKLYLRFQEKERKVEVAVILDRIDRDSREKFEMIEVMPGESPLFPIEKYVELGDTDYIELLKPDQAPTETSSIQPIEVISKTIPDVTERLTEEEWKLKSKKKKKKLVRRAKKKQEEEKGIFDLGFLKQFWPFEDEEEEKTKIAADSTEDLEESEEQLITAEDSGEEIEQVVEGGNSETTDDILIKGGESSIHDEEPVAVFTADGHTSKGNETTVISNGRQAAAESEKLMALLGEISKEEKEIPFNSVFQEMQKEVEAEKSKKWINEMTQQYRREKNKLDELTKVLQGQFRKREKEFKNHEQTMSAQLKSTEIKLRQQAATNEQYKAQIQKLNTDLEGVKSTSSTGEDSQLKFKMANLQKNTKVKDEEIKKFQQKIHDLENKLLQAQAKSRPVTDNQAQTKLIAAERKIEEFRRLNQRLTESLQQASSKNSDREISDLKRKLEVVEFQGNEVKRNLEKTSQRVKDLHDSERKAQTELMKANEENKKLKQQLANASGQKAA